MHALVTLFQACALTGHSTGTNLDSYLDALNPLRALPGANALHGNKDLHTKVVLPEPNVTAAPLLEASVLSTVSTSLRNTNLSERINKNEGDAGHNFADALV